MADPHPDGIPEDAANTAADSPPAARDDDARTDIEQAVEARSDAVEAGEGGDEVASFTDPGRPDGPGGTGGVVKNQEADQQ